MIRINLLGAPKPKGKRGSAAASAAAVMEVGQAGAPGLKFAVVLLIMAVVNGGYWYRVDKVKKQTAVKMQAAEQKNRELADVKVRYQERQRQADAYKRRVDVIDQLRASQAGPVNLLNMLGETVNGTEAVWLNTMRDQGNSV